MIFLAFCRRTAHDARAATIRYGFWAVLLVLGSTNFAAAQQSGFGPPIFNYPPPAAATTGVVGGAQAETDDSDEFRPDAVKSKDLPVREEMMQPAVRTRFETFISE